MNRNAGGWKKGVRQFERRLNHSLVVCDSFEFDASRRLSTLWREKFVEKKINSFIFCGVDEIFHIDEE